MLWWFRGFPDVSALPEQVLLMASLGEQAGPSTNVCELCGGEARFTTLAVRRHFLGGRISGLSRTWTWGFPGISSSLLGMF